MSLPTVFISYAQKDEPQDGAGAEWLTYVTSHLGPLRRLAQIEPWADTNLQGGVDWENRIFAAIDACDIFVLLVSPHAMNSDFILNKEIPRILARQKASGSTETPLLYPILLTPCAGLRHVDWLRTPNIRPQDGKALSDFLLTRGENQRDPVMVGIADDIASHARRIAQTRQPEPSTMLSAANAQPPPPVSLQGRRIVDGYFDMPSQPSDRVLLDIGFIERAAVTIPRKGRIVFGVRAASLSTTVIGGRITDIRTAFGQGYEPPRVSVIVQPTAGKVVRHFDITDTAGGTLAGNPLRDRTEEGGPIEVFSVSDAAPDIKIEGTVRLDVSGVQIDEFVPSCPDPVDQAARESMMEKLAEIVLNKHGASYTLGAFCRDED